MKTQKETFAIISQGFGWNDTKYYGYSCDCIWCSYNDTGLVEGYKGWAPIYPKHYLIKV